MATLVRGGHQLTGHLIREQTIGIGLAGVNKGGARYPHNFRHAAVPGPSGPSSRDDIQCKLRLPRRLGCSLRLALDHLLLSPHVTAIRGTFFMIVWSRRLRCSCLPDNIHCAALSMATRSPLHFQFPSLQGQPPGVFTFDLRKYHAHRCHVECPVGMALQGARLACLDTPLQQGSLCKRCLPDTTNRADGLFMITEHTREGNRLLHCAVQCTAKSVQVSKEPHHVLPFFCLHRHVDVDVTATERHTPGCHVAKAAKAQRVVGKSLEHIRERVRHTDTQKVGRGR